MQSLQRLREKALGRQIVSVNAFVSSSFQVVAIKTDRKKVKCKNGKPACHLRSILIFAAAAMKLQIEGMVGREIADHKCTVCGAYQ